MPNTLNNKEITTFLQTVKTHNDKFTITEFINYKIYYKAFRWDYRLYLRNFLNLTRFKFLCTAVAGWGMNIQTIDLFKLAQKKNVPFFFIEDGFIRSIYTFAAKIPAPLKSGISFCVDTKGFYFDSNVSTDLEILLNTYVVSPEQKKMHVV